MSYYYASRHLYLDRFFVLSNIDKSILETVTKRRNYSFETITTEMVAEQQAIADIFYKLKLIPKSINVADAVWQSTTALGN